MSVPIKQAAKVGSYIFKQKLTGNKRYPLVLMIDILYRCNLACNGCGKIQHPEEILKKYLSVDDVMKAIDESGVPMVNIAGGEPLIHPQIKEMVEAIVAKKKFLYVCTNALLLKRKLDLFTPSEYLTFTIHMDGIKEHHDHSVNRPGTYETAVEAIKEAKKRGFNVTTNTTVFDGHPSTDLQKFFDEMTDLGVNGMMISPGYSYEKAPVQDKFLAVDKTRAFFKETFKPMREGKKKWVFNHSPFFLDFLEGKMDYECTPWSMPNYSVLGWQRPCYLFSEDGYAKSFKDLMENTEWEKYGRGKHEKCSNCMTHCGYEGTAVKDSMSSVKNMARSFVSSL